MLLAQIKERTTHILLSNTVCGNHKRTDFGKESCLYLNKNAFDIAATRYDFIAIRLNGSPHQESK